MPTTPLPSRLPCAKCGALILPATAKRTDGFCRPCFNELSTSHGEKFSCRNRPTNAIRNCDIEFRFRCPLDWSSLETTDRASVRHCQVCQQKVYFCADVTEALAQAREGHCVALPGENGAGSGISMRLGMAKPLTREEKALVAAEHADIENTQAIRAITPLSRICPECGYPRHDQGQCRHE